MDLTCLVLVGGSGTRLREAVPDLPKPLAPVAGKPFLNYLLGFLARQGVRDFVLCCGYQTFHFDAYVASVNFGQSRLVCSHEEQPLGTAGALRQALPLVSSFPVLVVNGDSFFNFNLAQLIRAHLRTGARGTLAAAKVPNAARFGTLQLGPEGIVQGFLEKTGREEPGIINAGVYLLEGEIIQRIPVSVPCSIEREIFPKVVARNELYASVEDEFFIDIGVPEDYFAAQKLLGDWSDRYDQMEVK